MLTLDQQVFLKFIPLLATECTPMTCVLCGPYPKWMGFDGVALSMSKDNVLWDTVETIHPRDGSTTPPDPTVLEFQDRLLLPTPATRRLLAQFCNSKPSPLNCQQYSDLVATLQMECTPLSELLQVMYQEEVDRTRPLPVYNYSFPGVWCDFLLLLSSSTSVAWMLRPAAVPVVLHLIETQVYTKDAHHVLYGFCPSLAFGLLYLPEGRIPTTLVNLLQLVVEVVERTYPNCTFAAAAPLLTHATDPAHHPQDAEEAWQASIGKPSPPLSTGYDYQILDKYTTVPELDPKLSGTCWSFPRIRVLPRFEGVDPLPSSTNVAQWKDTGNSHETDLFCLKEEKRGYTAQKHTAGLFVGCCLHAVCYGFHSMVAPEGRKDLLKVLYERMPQEVLDQMHVLYDFNCQQGEYMLNRVPEMFSNIRLFIDRFHATSHKCASAFKLQAYPVFQELPSTGSESLNLFLQHLHGQAPFMRQDTFVSIVRACVGLRNYIFNCRLLKAAEKLAQNNSNTSG